MKVAIALPSAPRLTWNLQLAVSIAGFTIGLGPYDPSNHDIVFLTIHHLGGGNSFFIFFTPNNGEDFPCD